MGLVCHLSQECSTYTPLFPHVLTACLNCQTSTSGITTATFGGHRNKYLSSTLAFQSHNLIPSSDSTQWPLPKHKTNIITSTWDNHCGVLAHRTHCRAIKAVESLPLNLQTQQSNCKLSHISSSQDSSGFFSFLWHLQAPQMNFALQASLCWTLTQSAKPQALIRPEHTWGGYNLKELPFWGLCGHLPCVKASLIFGLGYGLGEQHTIYSWAPKRS